MQNAFLKKKIHYMYVFSVFMLKLGEEDKVRQSNKMWIHLFFIILSLSLVAAVFAFADYFVIDVRHPKPDPPHIIFVLIDDLGWNDVSFHGSAEIRTPNMDALAASGIILNSYYTHPHCTPSRGALLSGKYANRIGLQHEDLRPMEPAGLPKEIKTLPQYLKDLGYKTHMVGKWHLGYHTVDYLPTRRGFDSFFGNLNGHMDYFDYTVLADGEIPSMFGVDLWENEQVLETANYRGRYATSLYTDKAIDIISQHNVTKPLFLLLSLTACHVANSYMPFQAPPQQVARHSHISNEDRRKYAGMVSSVDDSVGLLFEILQERKMLENTILVVSSDNGGLASIRGGASSNFPLRGMKYYVWEGGVRSTSLLWSPLLRLSVPRTSTQLMHITDWLPTFYSLAGGDIEDLVDIDGINMWPALADDKVTSPRKDVLLHLDPAYEMGAFRQGDMKIVFGSNPFHEDDWYGPSGEDVQTESLDAWVWEDQNFVRTLLQDEGLWLLTENDTWRRDAMVVCGINFLPESGKCGVSSGPCLYNITQDPCEFRNLAGQYPDLVESMMNRVAELNQTSIQEVNAELDSRGDPRCSQFAFAPWMNTPAEVSECPWL